MYPVLFGLQEGNALSSNGEWQLEAWTAFLDSFQTRIEELLTMAFTQVLREQGNASTPVFELKRNTSFVQKQRAERLKLKTEVIQLWFTMGIIDRQTALTLLRTPDAFDNLDEILEPELAAELAQLPLPAELTSSTTTTDDGGEGDE